METQTRKNGTSIIAFNRRFPNEKACKAKFLEYRLKSGITCPHCGCKHHYWISTIERFQCKNCGYRQSIRANTVMHYSKLPFRYWFIAMWLIANTKNSYSTSEIQRQLGHEYYRPIWTMMQKIRKAMGVINNNIVLNGEVELDECYISTRMLHDLPEKTKEGKEWSHKKPYTITKTKCVIACESIQVEQSEEQKRKYKLKHKCGRLMMVVVPDFKMKTIRETVQDRIEHDSIIRSDATHCHYELPQVFKNYTGKVIPHEELSKTLPYVHIAIGNLKALIRNVHHSVEREFLQSYINEFVWKFNHRFDGRIFDKLVMDMSVIKAVA